MPVELSLDLGQRIQPALEKVNLNTREGVTIPLGVLIEPFYYVGAQVRGVSALSIRTLAYSLFEGGFAAKFTGYRNEEYIIYEQYLELFKRLNLNVKLPGIIGSLKAFPWRYGLVGNGEIRFSFFDPNETNLPVLNGTGPRHIRKCLPCLVLPSNDLPMLDEEQRRGFLAIPSNPNYQNQVEISFTLLKSSQTDKLKIKLAADSKEWKDGGVYAGIDWGDVFGHLPTSELGRLYLDLNQSLNNLEVNTTEIEFMKDQMLLEGRETDFKSVTKHLLMLKASQACWIEKMLWRRRIYTCLRMSKQ